MTRNFLPRTRWRTGLLVSACGVPALWLAGCTAVPAYQQGIVSQPGMLFSDSPVLASEAALLTQVEPGTASSGGGQAAGCSSCR